MTIEFNKQLVGGNMDLEKKYYDADRNECNILEFVKKDPEWAANIIQYYDNTMIII